MTSMPHGSMIVTLEMEREQRQARGASELSVTHASDELMIAKFGSICIAVWATKPRPDLFEIQRAHLAAVVAEHPGRACFMCVVSANADPPDQEIRDASSKMMGAHGKQLAACACVIEGSDFRSAITRTVLAGIMLVVKTPSPFTFVDSVSSATRWLETKICRHPLPGLVEQLARARAQAMH